MVYFINKIFIINFLIACLCNNVIVVAQSSFSPSDISGLKLWLRSDTGMVLSGNMVDQWNDISGNSNNAFQTISSIKPTLYASDTLLNNYPAVKFDGTGSRLETMYVQPDAYSIFIVYAHRNGINGSFYSTNQPGYPLQRNSVIWPNSNLAPYTLSGGNLLNIKNLYVDVHDFLNDNYSTYLNGIQSGSASTPISKSGGFFNIGSGGGEPLDGSISEFLIYDNPIADSLRFKVEDYLMNRYAPDVNLGVDKTVCNFPITIKAKKKHFTNYIWQDSSTADSLVINGPGIYYVNTTDIFNKISSDTIIISLSSPTYTVVLGNDTTICNGKQVTLNAGPGHLSYLWSNGLTTNTILVNTQANYSVSVTDCSGNISKDTIKVTVKSLPIFNFGSDSIICNNSGFVLDPGFINSTTLIFDWQDSSVDSTHNVLLGGQYYLNVRDYIGCSYSDTVNLQIDSSLNNASLGPDTSLCAGNVITLTSGMSPSLTYTWSTGSNNNSLLITNSGQYSVVVTNTNNCIAKDTIIVAISGQAPIANFSSSVGCLNTAVSFTNLSIPASGNTITSSDWNFGDPLFANNTSTLSNPFHTFSDTGTYSISLKVTTNVGCKQSITKTIHIAPTPTVNFSNGISCQNDSTAFTSSITSSPGYSITSLSWNFGDPTSGINNSSHLSSPKHLFNNQTSFSVTLVATNNAGCSTSKINIIAVKAEVKASFTNSPPCSNTAVIFQDNSIAPPSSARLWNFGTSTSSGLTTSKTYTSSGIYSVTLTVTGTNFCTSNITKQIIVFLPPAVNFTIPSFCSKDTITAINQSLAQSGIISSYNWKLNNTTFSAAQNPTLTASAGTYSVKLTIVNSFNCKDSITKPITVLPLPNVDFTTNPPSYYFINDPVNFIPTITNASSYQWDITGVPTSTIQSPTASFNTEGSYTVSLNLKDQQGCKNSKTKTITVSKRYLDLAVLNVNAIKDNDGFITVEADIANNGSVPVTTFDIHYKISDAGNIKETWNGTLNPNAFYVYTFIAKSASQKNTTNNITCVEIEKANGIIDENTSNNSLCNTLNADEISVSNPIPNPTDGDITLPIILNKDIDFTIAIYNSTGQIVYEETTKKGIAGLNFVTLPTSSYARGCYIIKIMIDGKIFIKKFIKIRNE